MIGLFRACGSSILTKTRPFVPISPSSWKTSSQCSSARIVNFELLLTRFQFKCYSSKKSGGGKQKLDPEPVMKDDKEAFFVVRKGDLLGVYKSLSDCQAQVGTSICDPPVSVYKGYAMPKDTEKYLMSCGLKNALYSIKASDFPEGLFGALTPCPFQPSSLSRGETSSEPVTKKRPQEALWPEYGCHKFMKNKIQTSRTADISRKHLKSLSYSRMLQKENVGAIVVANDALTKHFKLEPHRVDPNQSVCRSCTLEFDGASKGNPGQAGAGAVLRSDDGSFTLRLREGLGIATNNVAEYKGFILGLRHALKRGFTSVRVRGDSKLVCMQIQGLWKVKNHNISNLYEEAKKLKDGFLSFQIMHILRDLNSEADAQANLAVELAAGEVQEEADK